MSNDTKNTTINRLQQISEEVRKINPEFSTRIDQEIQKIETNLTEKSGINWPEMVADLFLIIVKFVLENPGIFESIDDVLEPAFKFFNAHGFS